MNERDKRAREIFEQAVEIESAEARAAFLEKGCGEDHALRADVDSLLEAHANATGFLEPSDEAGKIRGQVNQPVDATLDGPAIERAGAVL